MDAVQCTFLHMGVAARIKVAILNLSAVMLAKAGSASQQNAAAAVWGQVKSHSLTLCYVLEQKPAQQACSAALQDCHRGPVPLC